MDEHLCLDPASVLQRITPRTRAVMFVGMGGNVGRYPEVLKLCRERGLTLILDAAHMAGTRYRGTHVGGDADAAVFSFQAVKNLPTADSGMICFAGAADDEMARKLTWLGINKDTYARTISQEVYKWKYDVEYVGYKYSRTTRTGGRWRNGIAGFSPGMRSSVSFRWPSSANHPGTCSRSAWPIAMRSSSN